MLFFFVIVVNVLKIQNFWNFVRVFSHRFKTERCRAILFFSRYNLLIVKYIFILSCYLLWFTGITWGLVYLIQILNISLLLPPPPTHTHSTLTFSIHYEWTFNAMVNYNDLFTVDRSGKTISIFCKYPMLSECMLPDISSGVWWPKNVISWLWL